MKIKDTYGKLLDINKPDLLETGNSIEVLADDGCTLFGIELKEDGRLRIDFGSTCKHDGKLLDTTGAVIPIASNCLYVRRDEYIKPDKS